MAREIPKQKTARALRKLARVARQAEEADLNLTSWEKDFVSGVTGRLETYGSAFRDPQKGALEEPLSQRQSEMVRLLTRKTRARKPEAEPDAAGNGSNVSPNVRLAKPLKIAKLKKPMSRGRGMRPAKSERRKP